jgi:hypothetical protein
MVEEGEGGEDSQHRVLIYLILLLSQEARRKGARALTRCTVMPMIGIRVALFHGCKWDRGQPLFNAR